MFALGGKSVVPTMITIILRVVRPLLENYGTILNNLLVQSTNEILASEVSNKTQTLIHSERGPCTKPLT